MDFELDCVELSYIWRLGVVKTIIESAFLQVFEELFSQNTDGTMPKFLKNCEKIEIVKNFT